MLLRVVLQDALSEVVKVYLPMKLKVFVDDIPAFLEGRNKGLPDIAEKVVRAMRMDVEDTCSFLEEKFEECNKREGVCFANSVET